MIGQTRMRERMRWDGEAAGGTPARRRTRFAQVVDELGRRVVSGDFDGSGVLPIEPQLAAELGVSRNLLREAVKVLAGKGLLDVRPKRGTRLRAQPAWHLLDPDGLAWLDGSGHRLERSFDLVEFRLIVEPMASYLAAGRGTPARRARSPKPAPRSRPASATPSGCRAATSPSTAASTRRRAT